MKTTTLISCVLATAMLAGCSSTYYKTMETFGWHKRDILVDRVEDARDSQQAAKEQFKTALERFNELLGTSGGELKAKYDKLNSEYTKSKARADAVSKRISDVESVANDLFKEWKNELEQYSNKEYRAKDEQLLRDTRNRYEQLISAMKRAEAKMEPVLLAFQDRVIFLKHNLNAQAVASLQGELASVEVNVEALVKEMEASMQEADSFISEMSAKQ
jgi:Skp family chaperone for outer membrane proteins